MSHDAAAVLVIGNGPVGQTTSLLLARWGIPSIVVDARPHRDQVGSRAICQHRDVLDVWEAVGAGRQVADEGVTWSTGRTFYKDHELFAVQLSDAGRSAFPPFVNISQSRTEVILQERMDACPAIDQRWSHRVVAIGGMHPDDPEVVARCETHAGEVTLRAPYAVLAAGGRGRDLHDQLGVEFPGTTPRDRFIICDIRAELPGWERERRFYFDPAWNPGRQVLIHPTPGGVYRIDWQVPDDVDLDEEERTGQLDRRIRAIIGPDAPYEVVWRSIYSFSGCCADRMRAGRVLLAGDCAHLFAPFGARGLNSGVHDAENAAWKLAFVLRGWAPDSLLDTYDIERRAAAIENLEVTETTMRFLVPRTAADVAWRLDVLDRSARDPDARSQVDSGRMYEPFWYVDSPLVTPNPERPFPGRPAHGHTPPPLPGVLVPDVPAADPENPTHVRLRDLVRDGFLALVADPGDVDTVHAAIAPASLAPARALAMSALTPDGTIAAVLGTRPGEVWLIRPDGHVAAVVAADDLDALRAAVARIRTLTRRGADVLSPRG